MLPVYGIIRCRARFSNSHSDVVVPHPDWRMVNDPGAWGGSNPDFLVLGFSKGATQAGIYRTERFEDIAFAGMRPRLTQALQAMGVLSEQETSDQKIANPGSNIAFGSLIRCSVSRRDKKASAKSGTNVYACTGSLISKSFSEITDIIRICASTYLKSLPDSVRIVFFLGNTDSYVKSCQRLIHELFPNDFSQINSMAVKANGRLWVYLAHPSGLNGHFNAWLKSASGSGVKRIEARLAVDEA
jgi:hypothetical protein